MLGKLEVSDYQFLQKVGCGGGNKTAENSRFQKEGARTP